jgi:hypothetical protein
MTQIWEVTRAKYGEQDKALEDGWEPFGVTSQPYQIEKGGQFLTVYSDSVYIYLRRQVAKDG